MERHSKKNALELLASTLNKKKLLEKEVKTSYFRIRENEFFRYFESGNGFVYCQNTHDLIE